MYKRDVGILLLSVFAVYFSVQNEGPFTFRKAWVLHGQASSESSQLPSPIVADLNGDGKMEVIVATQDGRLKLLAPRAPGHAGEGFASVGHLAEVDLKPNAWPASLIAGESLEDSFFRGKLLSKAVSEAMSRGAAKRAIAVKSGYLDRKPQEIVRAPRKQVIVVVLADWTVICLNHNLQKLWYTTIRENPGGPYGWATFHAHVREVAILISNHTMREGDRGVVVVGSSVDLGDLADDDPLEAELRAEQESYSAQHNSHRRPTPLSEDKWRVNGVDVSKHFSYYALEGGTGQARWKHEGQDFHREIGELAEDVIPQHNYRLDAKSAEGRHYGEVACREFWGSVLRVMPHSWSSRSDTALRLMHFKRQKEDHGERKADLDARGRKKHSGQRVSSAGPPPKRGVDHNNPVTKLVAKAAEHAVRDGSQFKEREEHALPANVILAHLEEGIEAVHLYTGRTICKLHLPPSGLHTDLNADGVLDHIQVVGENHLGEARSDTSHRHMHSCWATAHSGVPPLYPLFNGSICKHAHSFATLFDSAIEKPYDEHLQVAPPIVLPAPLAGGGFRRGAGLAIFLNSHGEMTALDGHGERIWQHDFDVSWKHKGEAVRQSKAVASLQAIPLRWGTRPTVILAAGDYDAVVVSEKGHLLDRFAFPAAPSAPLISADFTGDGLTDVMVVSEEGIFGYAQVRRPGGVPFSILLALLIMAMIAVYTTHQTGPKASSLARSTDRVD